MVLPEMLWAQDVEWEQQLLLTAGDPHGPIVAGQW